jgi:hypothetical protein
MDARRRNAHLLFTAPVSQLRKEHGAPHDGHLGVRRQASGGRRGSCCVKGMRVLGQVVDRDQVSSQLGPPPREAP